jgi:hypothetical protein
MVDLRGVDRSRYAGTRGESGLVRGDTSKLRRRLQALPGERDENACFMRN